MNFAKRDPLLLILIVQFPLRIARHSLNTVPQLLTVPVRVLYFPGPTGFDGKEALAVCG